ncbi:monoacylglycerol lipase ABHD2-like isoform X1 [Ciona intestinalis]
MLPVIAIGTVILLFVFIKFLRIHDETTRPKLHHSGSGFIKKVISKCPSLTEIYQPPSLWGKCGHIQTAIYGKIGRIDCPQPNGKRHSITLATKETITFDVFQPVNGHRPSGECTILVCPGICNSSEKKYVRTFIHYAVNMGFRVAVLNHIGALPNVRLTSPKIFTYGETKYFDRMVQCVTSRYPASRYVIVGFSMGANIVVRYLAEDRSRQLPIVCAVSWCQGYDGLRSTHALSSGFGRFYNYMVTMNFKKILKPHWNELFKVPTNNNDTKLSYDEKKVESATTLAEIEDGLLRHFDGFKSHVDYKALCGCAHMIDNIHIPILLLNSEDDPLIISDVHDIPISYSRKSEKALFAAMQHGGHLGFYKGKWYKPDATTLLESITMEYIEAILGHI